MLCEACHTNNATVFYRQSVNGTCSERHLCADCAKKENLLQDGVFAGFGSFGNRGNMGAFGALDEMNRMMERLWREPFAQIASLPFGGLRMGADEPAVNYENLREGLQPFFQKEETGHAEPVEKSEAKNPEAVRAAQELAEMKSKLSDLVAAERYEEAAKLRDEIKSKEG
jgi:protein arginine kinase activator